MTTPQGPEQDVEPDDDVDDLPTGGTLTLNRVVARRMTEARQAVGWTQGELGRRLSDVTGRAWSKATVSAAERSALGGRTKQFDAGDLAALAFVFRIPVAYFLLPPVFVSDGELPRYALGGGGGALTLPAEDLLHVLFSEDVDSGHTWLYVEELKAVTEFYLSGSINAFTSRPLIESESARTFDRLIRWRETLLQMGMEVQRSIEAVSNEFANISASDVDAFTASVARVSGLPWYQVVGRADALYGRPIAAELTWRAVALDEDPKASLRDIAAELSDLPEGLEKLRLKGYIALRRQSGEPDYELPDF